MAKSILEQAIAIYRSHDGVQAVLAFSLNNLAEAHHATGDHATAEPLFRESLELRRAVFGKNSAPVAVVLHNLARLQVAQGNYSAAKPLFEQALAIRAATVGENHPDYALTLGNLAELHYRLGHFANAETLLRLTLLIQRKALGPDDPVIAVTLDNLGSVYQSTGKYAYAEQHYRQAGAILRHALGETHLEVAKNDALLALLFSETGNYAAAAHGFERALEIARAVGDRVATATITNNLALLCEATGRSEPALRLFQQALEMRREVLGDDHPDVAQSLNNLAAASLWLDPATAKSLYERALEIRRRTLGAEHEDVAQSLNNLAHLHQANGDFRAAEPLFREALEIHRKALGEQHSTYARTLHNLALVLMSLGRLDEGLAIAQRVEQIHDRLIGEVFGLGSERQRLAYVENLQSTFHAFLSFVLRYRSDDPAALRAAFDLVLSRKALSAEAVATQRDAVLGGRYPQLTAKLQELAALRTEIAQKTLGGPAREAATVEASEQELAGLSTRRETLEAELARQIPEMNLARRLQVADRLAIVGALPSDSTLVEFVRVPIYDFAAVALRGELPWKPERYLAFILAAGESEDVVMVDLGEADAIDALIADVRESITGESERRDDEQSLPRAGSEENASSGTRLRAAVFDPLRSALAGRTRLFLAPDGDLTRLPFEVLPVSADRRMIDEFRISYLSVARDILGPRVDFSVRPTSPIVAADPDFDLGMATAAEAATSSQPENSPLPEGDPGGWEFPPLLETREEGEEIARLLGVQPLVGAAVLKGRIRACRSPRILHIATHGIFQPDPDVDAAERWRSLGMATSQGGVARQIIAAPDNPMLRSGLALAGANWKYKGFSPPPEAEDGMLTAEDVAVLDLTATELVVLSACETGLGSIESGEGVFGLRRAFMLAGAKTLVMSLWKVPDLETRELMVDLYGRILAGEPCAEALRAAQLALKMRQRDPLFWGAFICQGRVEPATPRGVTTA